MAIRSARNGTVPPPWATMKRISGQRLQRAGVNQIDDGAGGVEDILDGERRRVQAGVLGRFAVGRMDKHHRLAPVELVEDRIEQRVAQIAVHDAGKKPDTVEVQDVERIG